MKSSAAEFQEIGHCGGQFTVSVRTDEHGTRSFQLGVRHSRPTPASFVGVYAVPPGLPVGMMHLGGIGVATGSTPGPEAFSIFVASDSLGMFGHKCPGCNGYWRSQSVPASWRTTCPYCGTRAESHHFLTQGQRRYIAECCGLIQRALSSDKDGESVIDMDQVADAVGKNIEKPKFYYAEESQQNRYECGTCNETNDILGRYGYCSSCAIHNGLQEFSAEIERIRKKIAQGEYEALVKEVVASFDSFARQIAKQLAKRIPMTPKRQKEWDRKLFHQLQSCAEALESVFDIKLFNKIADEDRAFAVLMFHRRHVYEHNGGEVDEKYIQDSGDKSVRPKQVIRETAESTAKIIQIVQKMAKNFHDDFHTIFPPEEKAIRAGATS